MDAYHTGLADGRNLARHDRIRKYETDKAETNYWRGYVAGVQERFPGCIIVRCEREGKIFAVRTLDCESIECPICGRRYMKQENGSFESDRKLTIMEQ